MDNGLGENFIRQPLAAQSTGLELILKSNRRAFWRVMFPDPLLLGKRRDKKGLRRQRGLQVVP